MSEDLHMQEKFDLSGANIAPLGPRYKTELDYADFETIENIPIFAEVEHEDAAGNPVVWDAERLEKIASVNNDRISLGEYPVIIIGHSDGEKEDPAIGFIDNFTTGIRNGLVTVFAQLLVYKDKLNLLKSYPKRSLEVYQNSFIVPALALLGSNEPALDLGLLYKQQDRTQLLQFSSNKIFIETLNTFDNDKDEKMVSDELKNQILEVLAETDVFAYCRDLMEKNSQEPEIKDEVKDEDMKDEEKDEPKDDSPEEVKDESEMDDEKKEKNAISAELASLKLKYQRSEREKALMCLEQDGHVFDLNEELEDVADMTEVQFDKHCNRIRKFSKKAPVNLRKFTVASVNNGGSSVPTKDMDVDAAKKYAIENGVTFQAAYKLLKK